MEVTLKPEAMKFIADQIQLGGFQSPDEVVEVALEYLMSETADELDDETIAAINEAHGQADRGEVMTLDEFKAEWNKR